MSTCPACRAVIPLRPGRGRPQKYCNEACRSRYRRSIAIPSEMTSRRAWVRADGKRPVQVNGRPASTTDPATWSTYAAVKAGPGDGYGIMLGDGLGCIDLDDVTPVEVARVLEGIAERVIFIETSQSGEGVHIFIEADEGPGGYVTISGVRAERYTRARFIRVTGRRLVK